MSVIIGAPPAEEQKALEDRARRDEATAPKMAPVEGAVSMSEEEMDRVESEGVSAQGVIESMHQLEEDRKARRGVFAITSPLWEYIEEIISTYCAAFPLEVADFKRQVEERRARATNKYNVVEKGPGATVAPHIEYRAVLTFPVVEDRYGNMQELLPVLQGAFERYGYPDFPQLEQHAKNRETYKVTKEFMRRFGHMFMLPEKY